MFKNRLISSFAWLYDAGVAHMVTGFSSLNNQAGSRVYSDMRFFCARNTTTPRIMAGRSGGAFRLAGSLIASLLTPLRLATPFSSVVTRLRKINQGASKMAVSARPCFVWRFIQCQEKQTSLFSVIAATEREALAQLPHAKLIFVARIRQEVGHV
ncbi:TPA: host cell division inhibitor Icd-like protein [Escherichia coli]|nr:host cell division inhibitor Icd-like protein [Escherichia coli O146]